MADHAANQVISACLAESDIVCLSEESDDLCLGATKYWLVDPLDGTKDFLAGNDEFTINIGLICDNKPILGVVFVPALDSLFWGAHGLGAYSRRLQKVEKLGSKSTGGGCRSLRKLMGLAKPFALVRN